MSTNQLKRRGEADDSGQTQKRSRLIAPRRAGASEPKPDFKESGTLSFELAGEEFIGVTADSSDSEDINLIVSDSGSVVCEQNQQHPLVSRTEDDSAILLASEKDVEPKDSDGAWPSGTLSSPNWMDEYLEWEQNQEYPLLSTPVDDSVVLLASDDDEILRDNNGLFGPLASVVYKDCFLWQTEQNQQHPLVSRAGDNSAMLLASDEEEGRNNNSAWPSGTLSSPDWMDEYLELIEGYEQQRSQQLLDSSVLSDDDENETTDNDVSVTDSSSEEGDSSEDETESSDAWPAGIIRCPICMDFYPQIMQSGRLILSTLCGHVFCSQCLPFALQTASFCPTCRTDLTPQQYHPIYI
ncbi:E3 ubiquitin-protein ligase RNF4-like isoform X2 [Cyanistes caeruleus]|uniref:E3 ubiquitin-protein ligase RNF4-like isoform X2 n=1 Tax=Cyanistes caeruleus TaxID=156563 RepID=UPI000CDA01F7|nr:E3 ubiquitin-protein ligase RNF4-like isoform X2 [Cyanistes caeruleus]